VLPRSYADRATAEDEVVPAAHLAAPDPYPLGRAPITYYAYTYMTPAQDRRSGQLLAGTWFACLVDVDGSRRCVLLRAVV
jgi:hypothetical protein